MHTKRIIPCLDVNNGRVVKGINFVNLKDAGDPVAAIPSSCSPSSVVASASASELVAVTSSARILSGKEKAAVTDRTTAVSSAAIRFFRFDSISLPPL